MHGHSPVSALLVNAEVDSMGGVIDVGVGVDSKTSPRRAAIEKAQAELRQEFDVREERRRELEFLEKGGNPLDFKLGPATSISVQSTSLTDQLAEQYVISEAKGSFVLTASPHGDSVESSGRPGVSLGREPNSADNLLLFDGENDILDRDKNAIHPSRGNIAPSEQSSQLDGIHNAKESKGQAYIRRNRSRSNRESPHVCSSDLVPFVHGNGNSILPSSRHDSRDAKGSLCEEHTEKDHTVSSICNSKPTSPNGNAFSKTMASDNQLDLDLDPTQAQETTTDLTKVGRPEYETDIPLFKNSLDNDQNQQSHEVTEESPNDMTFAAPGLVGERKEGVPAVLECAPRAATEKTEKITTISQINGFNTPNIVGKDLQNECQNSGNSAFDSIKSLDLDSSCTQISHNIDGNIVGEQCPISRKANGGSNGNTKEHTSAGETPHIPESYKVKENCESKAVDVHAINDDLQSVHGNHKTSVIQVKVEEENRSDLQSEAEPLSNIEGVKSNDHLVSKLERNMDNLSGENSISKEMALCPQDTLPSTSVISNCELSLATFSGRGSAAGHELQKNQNCMESSLKFVNKEREDAILEEARTIEANLKRVCQLSVSTYPFEKRRKYHWDFVLEEMAWLANDFMQERVWKITAAAQMCHWVAFTGRFKFDEENLRRKQRKVSRTLATAITQFWDSAEVLLKSDDPSFGMHKEHNSVLFGSRKVDGVEVIKDKNGEPNMETSGYFEKQTCGRSIGFSVQRYAVRFLKYNSSLDCPVQAEAPATPDRLSDSGILEMLWEDQLSEESLFYPIPSGATEDYRKSVESHWAQYEKIGNNMQQEEFETSIYDSAAEFGTRENAYEEEEGETGMYYLPGSFEGNKSSKFAQRKRKNLQRSYAARQYEVGADLPYGHCLENKLNQPSLITGKRPSNSLNVGSIPTKRVRTAARQRVVSPYGAGATGSVIVANKTDVSSGDTSSFQDDQSSLHGGSQPKKAMEVESTGDFGRQLPFDGAEISTRPKKKKKAKHLGYKHSLNSTDSGAFIISGKGSTYDQRWQLDSAVQIEQRDHFKKRLESHHLESNGNSGLYGQHAPKKPKILKQLADASPENITPVTGSISSPVASQMSNMSNPNKLLRMIANRDRGRKTKVLKMSAGQSGSGSPWSLFEDQALVVLVHDMGPNWELVSDAINSTLQFKCIFRKPKECKERHKILMDRNANDGADSAEDSGSSQPYPSTLPGIPKGSARQLFQRLQGPMEEDTLKAHFEKIILIGQQQHNRKSQNDNQELKQIAPVHNSHVLALSQACSNGLSGGPLTPLDLCDATTSSPDVISLGYQGSHTSGLPIANHQGPVAPVVPTSGANSMLQGSSGVVLGSSLPLPSSAINAPARDAQRYGVPRPASLAIDEQQRMQHYNQMLSGRNIPQSSLAVPGALPVGADRGVRMLPGGNGMGMMCGMNRGMSMPRPGFQGIGSPAMLNMVSSGSMLSSSSVGIPSPGAVSGQGNSMLRPRDTLHMLRPGQIQNPDDQRQMIMQELQMQVTQGNSQGGVAPFNGLNNSFSTQTVPSPVQTFPVQHQQQHQMAQQPHVLSNPHHPHLHQGTNSSQQQQVYAMRLANGRQLQQQQRFLHQQQHAMSPLQNSSQIPQQPSSHPVSLQNPLAPSSSPMNPIPLQTQQKQHHMSHGLGRGSLPNQMLKQRQRQHQLQQQQPRQHHQTQQRQHSQSQQLAGKQLIKGLGRGGGNMMMHQNIPVVDAPHVNGLSTGTVNQVATEKGEQVMHMMQGQGLFPGSGSSTTQSGKSNQSQQQQQKLFSRPPPAKQVMQMSSHPDNSNQGQVQVPSSDHALLASQQSVPSPLQQRQTSQSQQTIQRMIHQNREMGSDDPVQSPSDQVNSGYQMGGSANIPQCTAGSTPDSTGAVPVVSSSSSLSPSQWKPEVIYDTNTQAPNAHLASTTVKNSPQSNPVGSEPLPSSSQGLLAQRQFSGSLPIHGQWQQQQQQHHHHHHHHHRQAGQQGVLYARPSNSGTG